MRKRGKRVEAILKWRFVGELALGHPLYLIEDHGYSRSSWVSRSVAIVRENHKTKFSTISSRIVDARTVA